MDDERGGVRPAYVVYCDESLDKGKFFSNFYGAAIVAEADREAVEAELRAVKVANNLLGETKWSKIGEQYEAKYIALVDVIFDQIEAGRIKYRVMFTQNARVAQRLTHDHLEQEYFILYYYLIKEGLGLRSAPVQAERGAVSLIFDELPANNSDKARFKDFLSKLNHLSFLRQRRLVFDKQFMAEADSKSHEILQALDVLMGSMQFRLNDKHKDKPAGQRLRGKRTRAKERVYKHIRARIERLLPGFNAGTSTGERGDPDCRWNQGYRHWLFIPTHTIWDKTKTKGR